MTSARSLREGTLAMDLHSLRGEVRPNFECSSPVLSVVDLFAGCGGLTLGVAQAASRKNLGIEVRLAVDSEGTPIRVFGQNFPTAKTEVALVESLFDGDLGSDLTPTERRTRSSIGNVDLILGGPPCQGHSSLNNHTRRADPKNRLYLRMARAAEVLKPSVVVIENVPAVVHDSEHVVKVATASLHNAGYVVTDAVVELIRVGVPQRRKRHILVAARRDSVREGLEFASLLTFDERPSRTLRWAIGDLEHAGSRSWLDVPSRASIQNVQRMTWLFENDAYDLPNSLRPPCHQGKHSYNSMYGRLRWDRPAQTITSGFGSIGQGRFVHPSQPRSLTPHEAARIQGFPDYFTFEAAAGRKELAVIIGNAVPPQLTESLVTNLIDAELMKPKRETRQP